jgi:signal transduction histidine kinase
MEAKQGSDMRLADFILENTEAILAEWESFAATLLPAAAGMTPLALRDHAAQILEAIAKDITTAQTREEQSEKSKGRVPQVAGAPETAAQTHAVLRARSGFNIVQLVAEYRALRASVLRLWIDSHPLGKEHADELMRFNEAIDQAVAESVGHFHAHVELGRNLFLGMLGHDMRTPLNAIVATASYLAALNAGDDVSTAASRLIRSGASMQVLLDDLVDFNRSKLGLGLKVVPRDANLAEELAAELEQLRAVHAGRRIELAVSGDCRGQWDSRRLRQVLRNLVSNAIEHGSPDTPISVTLAGEETEARLEVVNEGPEIDASVQSQLFDPLVRGPGGSSQEGLGLGLFIVRQIALAHGGAVSVSSGLAGRRTTFTVILPRRSVAAAEHEPDDDSRRHEPARAPVARRPRQSVDSDAARGAAAHEPRRN